jgi:hypothetical protein
VDRRRFLLAAGTVASTVGSAGVLAGCGGDDEPRPVEEPVITYPERLEGDLSVAALLVSLENLLVLFYQEALDRRERAPAIPPASLAFLETALQQHKEHSVAWNTILTGAGKPAITGVNLAVKGATTDPAVARLRDGGALPLAVCHEVETVNAATYLAAMGAIENNAVLKVAASIHPVESAHVATLAFLLGRAPTPEAFTRVDGARPNTDSIG